MSMKPDQNPDDDTKVTELIHRHLLGDLEPEEFATLERNLISSTEARDAYLRAVRIDVALHDEAVENDGAVIIPMPAKSPWRTAAMAAALAIGAVVLWRVNLPVPPVPEVATVSPVHEIATLGDTRDCVWKNSFEVAVNKRLSASTLELSSGVAVIEFDGGARLALQGPAKLELIGTKTARLLNGAASVRCEEGLYSFSLLTPTSTVIDLGTEFGVAVAMDGESEVHVLDGEVEVTGSLDKERQQNQFLTAGKTLLLASNGKNRVLPSSTREWIRDYSTQADRDAKTVPPRVIARDRFPTEPDQPDRFNLGTGWRDAWWQSTPKRRNSMAFVAAKPLVSRDGQPTIPLLVGGWVEVRRFLAEPIDPTETQTIYLGVSLFRMNPGKKDTTGKLSEASVMFRSSADPSSVLGMALSGRNYLVVLERGGWERSETPVNGLIPQFMVAKVEFNPRRGNRVSMISYDQTSEIPTEEPGAWSLVTSRDLAKLTAPIDTIALQVRQAPFKFGEITLGNSWEAVTKPASIGN